MQPLAAVVITALGLAAMIWSMRMTTRRIVFDPNARQGRIRTRRGGQRSERTLPFDQVQDVVLQILARTAPDSLLARRYRHAIQHRDRLRAVWLVRLLTPQASLSEANARVQRDWLAP